MSTSAIDARRRAALRAADVRYLARRAEIIAAGAQIFRAQGYDSTTFHDLAEYLGVARASLYYYVGSKEELLQEIVRELLDRDVDAAEAIVRQPVSSAARVRALIESMVLSRAENYPLMNVYMNELEKAGPPNREWWPTIVRLSRSYETIVHSIFGSARQDGTLRADIPDELYASALFGMINWMNRWYQPDAGWSSSEIVDAYAKIFLGDRSNR